MRSVVWATAVAGLLITAPIGQAQQSAAISVGTVTVASRPITQATEFVGRVEAIDRVEVRARITGYLEDVLFKDCQPALNADPPSACNRDPGGCWLVPVVHRGPARRGVPTRC